MRTSWTLRILTLPAVFGLAIVPLAASGVEPLTHEGLAKLVLTIDEVRSLLEQEGWVVRSPAEPLLFGEPEGSITAAAIYGNEKLNNRLLQIALFYFETEELAEKFFAKPRSDAEKVQKDSTELAIQELAVNGVKVDEARVAISQLQDSSRKTEQECKSVGGEWSEEDQQCLRDQHRFLLFRWGRFVARFEINASQVFNQQDVTDEKLIKLAKAQFHILLNGR